MPGRSAQVTAVESSNIVKDFLSHWFFYFRNDPEQLDNRCDDINGVEAHTDPCGHRRVPQPLYGPIVYGHLSVRSLTVPLGGKRILRSL